MTRRYRVGIVGATGMVGQRFVTLLENHPWFDLQHLAASPQSAGRPYAEVMSQRWALDQPLPSRAADLVVTDVSGLKSRAGDLDIVFSAVSLSKSDTVELETDLARHEVVVVSNNSACRMIPDVPMIIPEVNPDHLAVLTAQRSRLGTRRGLVVAKSNCSLQSYVPVLAPLLPFGLEKVLVSTYQAVSGAGRRLQNWPEMNDNVIPFIGGEEDKSENEPLKIFGKVMEGGICAAQLPQISAQCVRVPVSDGHLATVSVGLDRCPSLDEIRARWAEWVPLPQQLGLPSAPKPFLTYFHDDNRPQTRTDREIGSGMGVAVGRLRPDSVLSVKFVALSHNTIRGAAGGAVLLAELLVAQGFV